MLCAAPPPQPVCDGVAEYGARAAVAWTDVARNGLQKEAK